MQITISNAITRKVNREERKEMQTQYYFLFINKCMIVLQRGAKEATHQITV